MRNRSVRLLLVLILATHLLLALQAYAQDYTGELNLIGVEINQGHVRRNGMLARARQAGATWVRYNGVLWSDVERTAPTFARGRWRHAYVPQGLAASDAELKALAARGLTSIVVLRGTPRWAVEREIGQDLPAEVGSSCLPIDEAELGHFAVFVWQVVNRYKRFPYRVRHWEIWNEPDAARQAVASPSEPYGCWGDREDAAYYGGEAFGRMLKVAYTAIKLADPGATVFLGGLMLTGDDSAPAGGGADPHGTGRFLHGVLHALYADGRYDAGRDKDYFDAVAFHSYAYWVDPDAPSVKGQIKDWDLYGFDWTRQTWYANGLSLFRKVAYLRDLLAAYNIHKPLVVNEGALICWRCATAPPAFLDHQANYLVRYYIRAWSSGLSGAAWYSLNDTSWQQSGLHTGVTPRPAYWTLRFLAERLGGATYSGQLSGGALEGYRFVRGNGEVHVYWTNDNRTPVAVPFPQGRVRVFDKMGLEITADVRDGHQLVVGFEPVLIEVSP